jgi:hypothetical protein
MTSSFAAVLACEVSEVGYITISITLKAKKTLMIRRGGKLRAMGEMTKEQLMTERKRTVLGFCHFYSVDARGNLILTSPKELDVPGTDVDLWLALRKLGSTKLRDFIMKRDGIVRQMFYSFIFSIQPEQSSIHHVPLLNCLNEFYNRGVFIPVAKGGSKAASYIAGPGSYVTHVQDRKTKLKVITFWHQGRFIQIKFGQSLFIFIFKRKNLDIFYSGSVIMLSYLCVCVGKATRLTLNEDLFDVLYPYFSLYIQQHAVTPLSEEYLAVVHLLTNMPRNMISILYDHIVQNLPLTFDQLWEKWNVTERERDASSGLASKVELRSKR